MLLSRSGLESMSGLRDEWESRIGQHTLLCLICRQRRRSRAISEQVTGCDSSMVDRMWQSRTLPTVCLLVQLPSTCPATVAATAAYESHPAVQSCTACRRVGAPCPDGPPCSATRVREVGSRKLSQCDFEGGMNVHVACCRGDRWRVVQLPYRDGVGDPGLTHVQSSLQLALQCRLLAERERTPGFLFQKFLSF